MPQAKYIWRVILILQLIAMLAAMYLFRNFDRSWAGLIAGSIFVVVGVLTFLCFLKFAVKWQKAGRIISGIYLFGAAFPMWFIRIAIPLSEPLQSVMGLPISVFHHISELLFMAVLFLTVAQIYFCHRSAKTQTDA